MKPFKYVRVDWYLHENKLIFGVLTFMHGSGFKEFSSHEWEKKWEVGGI